jgi:hypothetical protein
MCSYYLVEPVACTPAAGWEKGQVENQVGLARERCQTQRSSLLPKMARASRRVEIDGVGKLTSLSRI